MFLRYAGLRPVVVHGGGPQITAQLDRLGIESVFAAGPPGHHAGGDGRRPDGARRPGAARHRRPGQRATARSRSACPARTRTCSPPSRTTSIVDGEPVDLGLVGDVVEVDPGVVQGLLADGRIPVVSSVARGTAGEIYNVNADTAAAALAVALGAEKLVVLTDVEGLYADWPTDGSAPNWTT